MPGSITFGKPFVYFFVKEINRRYSGMPLRFLDVGAGMATYPKMLKSAFPNSKFTGIEIWAPYIEQFDLNYWYDEVIISDIRYLDWKKAPPFDIVLFGDILEHMTQNEAAAAVQEASRAGGFVITSIPLGHHPQHAEHGNPWERHTEADWELSQIPHFFEDVIGTYVDSFIGISIMCSSIALRSNAMESFLTVKALMEASADKRRRLDPFDYVSLQTVLDEIEAGEM